MSNYLIDQANKEIKERKSTKSTINSFRKQNLAINKDC